MDFGLRMISEMITTMQENLQALLLFVEFRWRFARRCEAETTKKAYCDAEMGKAKDKKASSLRLEIAENA